MSDVAKPCQTEYDRPENVFHYLIIYVAMNRKMRLFVERNLSSIFPNKCLPFTSRSGQNSMSPQKKIFVSDIFGWICNVEHMSSNLCSLTYFGEQILANILCLTNFVEQIHWPSWKQNLLTQSVILKVCKREMKKLKQRFCNFFFTSDLRCISLNRIVDGKNWTIETLKMCETFFFLSTIFDQSWLGLV